MFSITGSTMNAATSPLLASSTRSSASGSLKGIDERVVQAPPGVRPRVAGTAIGASAGPATSSDGFIETITSS